MTSPQSTDVNELHRYDDKDVSVLSHHHSLGVQPAQASPGDHTHDGKTSKSLSPTYVLYTTLQSFDALAAHLAGVETFTGAKTFTAGTVFNANVTATAGFALNSQSAGLEIGAQGSTVASNTPYIDFHTLTSGTANDYDVRMIASNGVAGANGNGYIDLYLRQLNLNSPAGSGAMIVALVDGTVGNPAPRKYLRSINGSFDIVNNGYSATIFGVTDAGVASANDFQVGGDSLARGRVTSAYIYASSGGFSTTEVAIVNPAPAFTAIAGRRYRVMLYANISSNVAGDIVQVKIRDGGSATPTNTSFGILIHSISMPAANYGFPGTGWVELLCVASGAGNGQINAGTHTLGMFAVRAAGSGTTLQAIASANFPNGFVVEDIGN